MPVTSAPAITVPAITWYGEVGICRLPELRVSVEPPFRKASFWSCRFCTAVGSAGRAAVEAGPAASGSKPAKVDAGPAACAFAGAAVLPGVPERKNTDRKSTRLNSSHLVISYAVFCLKKKTQERYSVLNQLPCVVKYDYILTTYNRTSAVGAIAADVVVDSGLE